MSDITWKVSCKAAATAVTLLLGASAQARVVIGVFDPSADLGIPGYKGSGTFNVAEACVPLGGTGWTPIGGSLDCGPVSLVSGSVLLYGPGPITGTPASSFTLAPGDLSVTGLYVVNGQVMGIDTSRSSFSNAADPVNGCTSNFALQFFSGCSDLNTSGVPQPLPTTPFAVCGDLFDFGGFSESVVPAGAPGLPPYTRLFSDDFNASPLGLISASLVFQQVPEPGSAALLGAALGAGWFARRRRNRSFDVA